MDDVTNQMLDRSHTLVRALAATLPEAEIAETHISWVVLTPEDAYKFKKPVNLGFLDFSTLAARHEDCETELALNRRFAPALYLDVVAITGTPEHPVLSGQGDPIEYAVHMRRFDRAHELEAELARDAVTAADMRGFAFDIAQTHQSAPPAAEDSGYADLPAIFDPIHTCCQALISDAPDESFRSEAEALADWVDSQRQALGDALAVRCREGRIRECHGDLHVGNIVRHEGRLTAFDCIEFNAALRHVDPISDIAFLVMDLDLRQQSRLANVFVDAWLECSGDFAGMRAFALYLAYRSLVRAKIALIARGQAASGADSEAHTDRARRHLNLASEYSRRHGKPTLFITHGLSGSGKSWFAARVVERFGALRLRSDVERKRLFGSAGRAADTEAAGSLYTPDHSDRTYAYLLDSADLLLRSGHSVLVDAAFLDPTRRRPFRELASARGAQFVILDTVAPPEVLEARLTKRSRSGEDPSDADVEVMRAQLADYEPLGDREADTAIRIDTSVTSDVDAALESIAALDPAARLSLPRIGIAQPDDCTA